MSRPLRACDAGGYDSRCWRGFTLIEMAVALVVLGLIAIAIMKILPRLTDRMRLDTETVGLGDASEAIDGFALRDHRLPCPDVNGDGEEGTAGVCGSADQVGTIPYRSLGLPGPVVDEARLPLRYGVYRNADASADLTTLSNLYEPTIPGALTIKPATVTDCNVASGDIQITYANQNPAPDTLTVTNRSGSFKVKDSVSGSTLDYNNIIPNTPVTTPLTSCPCGYNAQSCLQCTNLVPGERIYLQGNTANESPNGKIDSIANSGSRLILPFPTGTFSAGNTIVGEKTGVTATVTDFYFPGTATISSKTSNLVFGVTLIPVDSVWFKPTPGVGFVPNQLLFSSSGGKATYVSVQQAQQGIFTVPEIVEGQSSGATGTIDADDGTVLTVSDVTGDFSKGETIKGQSSGVSSEIVSINTNVLDDPVVKTGSITIPDPNLTPSDQLNELDLCINLRNGILAANSTDQVYTVHDPAGSAVDINPAYLVVSGGVEDAIPGDIAFDGLNEKAAGLLDFNSPAMGRNARYDDVVRTTPMQWLDNRLSCPRNLAAVNAMAVSAMVAQNIAISAYLNHENAAGAVVAAWAGVGLADAGVAIQAFLVAISATQCAVATTAAWLTDGGSTPAAVSACAAAASAAGALAGAIIAQDKAHNKYKFTCDDERESATQLTQDSAAATAALDRALAADIKEGVQ